ncbi:MAG TPA: PA14 domain-containing protein [Bryobacteraceae bacterium]|nr:PA14 domain-containing protein [Bryobacteraceae bacterium]
MRRGLLLLLAGAVLAAGQEQPVSFGTTVVVPGGLEGVVYHIPKNSKAIPDLRKIKPQGKIYVSALNIPLRDFTEGFPGVTRRQEWFAIDYTGRFWIDKPGLYGFALSSDDGSRLYIDDQMVVDNDGIHPLATRSGIVELSGGIHKIHVQYFQGPRLQVALMLQIAAPHQEVRIFSTDEYKPPANPEDWKFPSR